MQKPLLLFLFLLLTIGGNSQVRVVSLSPIDTKTLVILGAKDAVVGCTKWCPLADSKPIVADVINANAEEVFKLQPDLVLASTLTSKESIKTIRQLGIKVILMPRMNSFSSMCDNVLLIGREIGKEEEAIKQVAIAQSRLDSIKTGIGMSHTPKVAFQIGAKPIFMGMPNTFINDYMTQSGAINIYADLQHGSVTRESVLLRNPEAIFISVMSALAEQEKKVWYNYKELEAVRQDKVVLIDQELASSPTIHTFVDVVGQMIDVLYK